MMRLKWMTVWAMGLALAVSGARAAPADEPGQPAGSNRAAKAAASDSTKGREEGKVGKAATTEVSAVVSELEELKGLLLEQSRQIQAQQKRIETLEKQIAATQAGVPGGADAGTKATDLVAGAQSQQELSQKVGKLEAEVAEARKSFEGGLKKFGPFTFSGDFRLRDEPFFDGPVGNSQVRNRERFRLRFNANAKFNDEISGGFSVASGDLNDPISTNQTANQFYTRKPFLIDRAYINYQPSWFKALNLTGGKFAYPWYRTELTWDNDLNPEGVAESLAWTSETSILRKIALVGFELPFAEIAGKALTNKSIVQSIAYGGQVQTNWQFGSRVKFGAYGAFYNYHNADPIAAALAAANSTSPVNGLLKLGGSSVQNSSYTVGGNPATSQFASRFALLDAIARFDFDTGAVRWPVTLLGDFVQNTRACANVASILAADPTATPNVPCNSHQRRGYWAEARFGRATEKGDWQFAYTRMFIEREAVMGAFNFSDLRQSSNVTQHRVELFYQAYKNVQLAFTGLIGRPLVTGSSPTEEPFLKRLQFDVVYKF